MGMPSNTDELCKLLYIDACNTNIAGKLSIIFN